jgi:acid phosphatase
MKRALSSATLAALIAAGCGDSSSAGDGGGGDDLATTGGGDLAGRAGDLATSGGGDMAGTGGGDMATTGGSDMATASLTTVVTVVMENHNYNEVVGNTQDAPFINSLINAYGLATNYNDDGHPSLPNYLWMTSGSNQGVNVDEGPTAGPFPVNAPNIGDDMTKAGIKWRAYMEGMGTACRLTDSSATNYAVRHNPFVYYQSQQNNAALCKMVDVDYSNFAADYASGQYRYMWVTPNLLDDGHDPQADPALGLQQTDGWFKTQWNNILASGPNKTLPPGVVVFLTWDEGEGGGDQIPMIVLSESLKKKPAMIGTAFDHSSYLKTVEEVVGLKPPFLGAAASAGTHDLLGTPQYPGFFN